MSVYTHAMLDNVHITDGLRKLLCPYFHTPSSLVHKVMGGAVVLTVANCVTCTSGTVHSVTYVYTGIETLPISLRMGLAKST